MTLGRSLLCITALGLSSLACGDDSSDGDTDMRPDGGDGDGDGDGAVELGAIQAWMSWSALALPGPDRAVLGGRFKSPDDQLGLSLGTIEISREAELVRHHYFASPSVSIQLLTSSLPAMHSLVFDPMSGGFVTSGTTGVPIAGDPLIGTIDFFLARLDANGELVWATHINDPGYDEMAPPGTLEVLAVNENGDMYAFRDTIWGEPPVAGATQRGPTGSFELSKHAPDGEELWSLPIDVVDLIDTSFAGQGFSAGRALAYTSAMGNSYVWVSFTLAGTSESQTLLVKIDSEGESVWSTTHSLGCTDSRAGTQVQALAASADDSAIYVLGSSATGTCLARLNEDGSQEWLTQLDAHEPNTSVRGTKPYLEIITGDDGRDVYTLSPIAERAATARGQFPKSLVSRLDAEGETLWRSEPLAHAAEHLHLEADHDRLVFLITEETFVAPQTLVQMSTEDGTYELLQ